MTTGHGPDDYEYEESCPVCDGSGAAPASPQAAPSAAASEPLTDVPFLIYYDDADAKPEVVIGEAQARAVFERRSSSWNAHLFVKIASNSRDDPYASKNAALAPPEALAEQAQAEAPEHPHWRRLTGLWRYGVNVLPPSDYDFYIWLAVLDTAIDERANRTTRL